MDEITKGNALMVAQSVCEVALVFPARRLWRIPMPLKWVAVGLIAGGSALALAGAITQGRQIRIHPIPPPDAVLWVSGPYAAMRHPIYTGILCAAAGGAILRARPEPVIAFATMTAVLSSKASFEEQLLRQRFGDAYDAYCARVPRGLPPDKREAAESRGGSGPR